MSSFFSDIDPVRFDPEAKGLAFRHYDPDRMVMGKSLKDHLRFAVAYWHSFAADGSDPFGAGTFGRPWFGDTMDDARRKADAAFEMFAILGQPFFCFHDHDVRPEGGSLAENHKRLNEIADIFEGKMAETGTKLLWGTANLFTHPRFMSGGATNPDPEVFAWSASTVRACMEVTHRLNGENYVLWGGREGYESLLNTDMGQELEHYGRFLSMVVEHKHKIGFKGQILVEPKPQEPSKHQYDFDVATVYGFLKRFGLEDEVKVNVEQGHAILAGHSFEHELATARTLGILGSIDMNRNDYQSGWDTDQFPNNVPEVALAYYEVLRAGGLAPGGTNFDAKLRRQSTDPVDLIAAHVGAMDVCARGLLAAAEMIEDDALEAPRRERYAGWESDEAKQMLGSSLSDVADRAEKDDVNPAPRSGRQEIIENIVNRYL
ncbi:xylose isomerase [Palleronia sp. LCG004]|uniref:xylose isomerase n=1 Tax=Palleronia sp. LCG004 TaxID=3079304 RepID=UPI0029427993|nr:xylose isomerase [Palleronia sp. LCG004]WOI57822.1 xylose isomerase [Palleronia sp. LCG004]